MTAPVLDSSFSRRWEAEILSGRPLILPPRHYVYPRDAEEVERGALEVLVRPGGGNAGAFLATCALGFRDPHAPTGVWSAPNGDEMCAVSGGYAYIIDTAQPERFTMIPYRPVLAVRPAIDARLLLFVGHRSILAWGPQGQAWESTKVSDEGVTISTIEDGVLRGVGWDLLSDKETPFALHLHSGDRLPSDAHG